MSSPSSIVPLKIGFDDAFWQVKRIIRENSGIGEHAGFERSLPVFGGFSVGTLTSVGFDSVADREPLCLVGGCDGVVNAGLWSGSLPRRWTESQFFALLWRPAGTIKRGLGKAPRKLSPAKTPALSSMGSTKIVSQKLPPNSTNSGRVRSLPSKEI
jgi:hypothetical protein